MGLWGVKIDVFACGALTLACTNGTVAGEGLTTARAPIVNGQASDSSQDAVALLVATDESTGGGPALSDAKGAVLGVTSSGGWRERRMRKAGVASRRPGARLPVS
jgi:hypothetical protein